MKSGAAASLLTSGVGRRMLALFLVAAIVPLMVAVSLVWLEFNRGLEEEAESRLRSSAKTYGVEILARLQLASDKATEIARITERESGGQPPVSSFASFATIEMRLSDSGPLPMMLTSLIGAVTLPPSTSQPFLT